MSWGGVEPREVDRDSCRPPRGPTGWWSACRTGWTPCARSEHAVFESIRRHAVQRTVLMITHRLASVRWADRIHVLERGRVVESGDHAELMERGGVYAEMYTLQAQAYAG